MEGAAVGETCMVLPYHPLPRLVVTRHESSVGQRATMQITIELPEDIAQGLESRWKNLPRAALESLAGEAYRSRALTAAQRLCPKQPLPHGTFLTGSKRLAHLTQGRPPRTTGADAS